MSDSGIQNPREARLWQLLAPVGVTVVLTGLWQFGVQVTGISAVVIPAPLDVAHALVREWPRLWEACVRTSLAALTGLCGSVVLGVLIAFAFSQSRMIRSALYPYAILLQTVPIIAIAPKLRRAGLRIEFASVGPDSEAAAPECCFDAG